MAGEEGKVDLWERAQVSPEVWAQTIEIVVVDIWITM